MIKSLTSLRGIFILFIFFHHCLHLYPGGGTMAVTFFFVLGGFSMTIGYKDKILNPNFSYRSYIIKRGIKFYPLHWLCILAVIPLVLLSFTWKQIPMLFVNAALLQTWIPVSNAYFSYNWVSWYLADTMFFAVVFPFFCKWIVTASAKGKIIIASVMALIYAVIAVMIPENMHHAILYISPYMRLTDFILGIFLAHWYMKLKEMPEAKWNSSFVLQIVSIILIVLLVVESCLLSEDVTLFAPVYWPFVALLVLSASLSGGFCGGGKTGWKTSGYSVLAN